MAEAPEEPPLPAMSRPGVAAASGGGLAAAGCADASQRAVPEPRSGPRAPTQRFGDLFPLPWQPLQPRGKVSTRAARRRAQRSDRLALECQESVLALNTLAGFGGSPWPEAVLNESQQLALDRIRHMHVTRDFPPNGSLNPRAALDKLLRRPVSTDYGDTAGRLCAYEEGCVSLPKDQGSGIGACDLVGNLEFKTSQIVQNFEECMLLPPAEQSAVFEDTDAFSKCYHDGALADPRAWAKFVLVRFDAKVIDFTSKPRVEFGTFFVTKKCSGISDECV